MIFHFPCSSFRYRILWRMTFEIVRRIFLVQSSKQRSARHFSVKGESIGVNLQFDKFLRLVHPLFMLLKSLIVHPFTIDEIPAVITEIFFRIKALPCLFPVIQKIQTDFG